MPNGLMTIIEIESSYGINNPKLTKMVSLIREKFRIKVQSFSGTPERVHITFQGPLEPDDAFTFYTALPEEAREDILSVNVRSPDQLQ